jgi:gluconokinase
MVFVITAAADADRNTVGSLLAESLGWEFFQLDDVCPCGNPETARFRGVPADANSSLNLETLLAAIRFWVYDWRDVVLSCPMLLKTDQEQICKLSSLVKVICLETTDAAGRTHVANRSIGDASTKSPARWHSACDARENILTLDSSREMEKIVAQITAVLMDMKTHSRSHSPYTPGEN